jgi:hypothetical protein
VLRFCASVKVLCMCQGWGCREGWGIVETESGLRWSHVRFCFLSMFVCVLSLLLTAINNVVCNEFSPVVIMMMILLLFLQKQNLAFAVYQFGSVLSLPD